MTNPTVDIKLVNNTGSSNAYAYVTGLDLNKNNVPLFMSSDGKTPYWPNSPSQPQQTLETDVAISLGTPGSTTTVTIPQIAGGRIWFAVDGRLTFLLNPGPAIVEPSVTNEADPNYKLNWGFCEFTYNQFQLFVNISYVDFVSLPIALEMRNEGGSVQSVRGLMPGGLDAICNKLVEQHNSDGAGWDQLIVKGPNGANLRALSPNSAIIMDNSRFQNYYQPYVDAVWKKYASDPPLTINTQASWGDVQGKVSTDNSLLTFTDVGTFAKPAAADVFSCSTGPFGGYPSDDKDKAAEMGAIGARLAAAFNRSTLLLNTNQPEGESVDTYYKDNNVTNHYARIVHDENFDGRGYAFPYDDVGPADGGDQSGSVFDGAPALLTVTLGGVTASAGEEAGEGGKKAEEEKDEEGEKTKKSDGGNAFKSAISALRRWFSGLKSKLTRHG